MEKAKTKGTIVDDLGEKEAEVLASAIVSVADAAKRLLASRLSEEAVLVLLKHSTGYPMRQIKDVLHHAAALGRFVKKPATK